jgi:arylsulfatase
VSTPNILWICSDQQRWDTLGCYGNSWVHTPNIDRLARSGVLFEHAYSQSPVCVPSRASFLTGRYPRTTRCRQNGQSIPADEVLVTKLLADAGYVCGLSGKLHLSACHPEVTPAMERRIDDGYADFHWSHDPDPKYKWPANEYFHWLREKDVEYQRVSFRGSPYVQVSMPAEHHQTYWCAQKAINFIEAMVDVEHPWLFSVNFFDPHHPFDPPEDYLERYLDRLDDVPLPNYSPGELKDKPVFQRIDYEGAYGGQEVFSYAQMTSEDHRLVRAAYWAMIDLIDAQVGRILDALERTGQSNNTLVIFMSDHGEMLGDHGVYLKGPFLYEPAVHVPLIIVPPEAILPGRRSSVFVELADLAPTLLEMARLPRYPGMQGRSLGSLLNGREDLHMHRDDIYSEYYNAKPSHKDPAAHGTMVRTQRYKLVAFHGLGEGEVDGELYDLVEDPQETRNLWRDPSYLTIKCDLLQRLSHRMAWTVDPLPERETYW